MSLTATHSTSAFASKPARNTLRPMRPKPLIPTRTGMLSILPLGCEVNQASRAGTARRPRKAIQRRAARERCAAWGRCGQALCRRLAPGALGAGDVAVADLDEHVVALAPALGEVLGDRHRPMAPARAADRDRQVRLALA